MVHRGARRTRQESKWDIHPSGNEKEYIQVGHQRECSTLLEGLQ